MDELDKQKAILVKAKSEGGQILIDQLQEDINDLIDKLIRDYEVVGHIPLIKTIASIEAKKETLDMLLLSEEKVKILKDEYAKKKKENN